MNTSIAARARRSPFATSRNPSRRATGFPGQIVFDTTKPDGTPRKLMDSSRILALGMEAGDFSR